MSAKQTSFLKQAYLPKIMIPRPFFFYSLKNKKSFMLQEVVLQIV